jgi:hypothetical protein
MWWISGVRYTLAAYISHGRAEPSLSFSLLVATVSLRRLFVPSVLCRTWTRSWALYGRSWAVPATDAHLGWNPCKTRANGGGPRERKPAATTNSTDYLSQGRHRQTHPPVCFVLQTRCREKEAKPGADVVFVLDLVDGPESKPAIVNEAFSFPCFV